MITFGIDCGVTGAVAALENGQYVGVADLPLGGVPGTAVRWADPLALTTLLRSFAYGSPAAVVAKPMRAYVERIHFSRQGGQLAAPTIMGSVLATLQMWGCSFEIVEALQWKRYAGLIAPKATDAQRKAESLERARIDFPTCDQLERKKDHNRAEALLIALYGWELREMRKAA